MLVGLCRLLKDTSEICRILFLDGLFCRCSESKAEDIACVLRLDHTVVPEPRRRIEAVRLLLVLFRMAVEGGFILSRPLYSCRSNPSRRTVAKTPAACAAQELDHKCNAEVSVKWGSTLSSSCHAPLWSTMSFANVPAPRPLPRYER